MSDLITVVLALVILIAGWLFSCWFYTYQKRKEIVINNLISCYKAIAHNCHREPPHMATKDRQLYEAALGLGVRVFSDSDKKLKGKIKSP